MADVTAHPRSWLFTLRVWTESGGQERAQWRGQLRDVLNDEVRYFRGWPALVEALQTILPRAASEDDPQGPD